ncbi:MAG: MarR family winged helix-turn-helix transcriptional regulator [Arachnia sp.]
MSPQSDSDRSNVPDDEWWLTATDFRILDLLHGQPNPIPLTEVINGLPPGSAHLDQRITVLQERGLIHRGPDALSLAPAGNTAHASYIEASGMTMQEWHLWDTFVAVQQRLQLVLRRQIQQQDDLSPADFEVLRVLLNSSDTALRIGDLASKLGWEQSRTSHQVARMMDRGLLRNVGAPEDSDRRSRWIAATRTGYEVSLRVMPGRAELLHEVFFQGVSAVEMDRLTQILAQIEARLDERLDR